MWLCHVGIQTCIDDLSGLVSALLAQYLHHLYQVCLTHILCSDGTPRLTKYDSIHRLTSGQGGLDTRLYWLIDWPSVVKLFKFRALLYCTLQDWCNRLLWNFHVWVASYTASYPRTPQTWQPEVSQHTVCIRSGSSNTAKSVTKLSLSLPPVAGGPLTRKWYLYVCWYEFC